MGKKVKLRAFKISVNDIKAIPDDLISFIKTKLETTTANDRRMTINENDNEEDLISDFSLDETSIFSAILRIRPAESVPKIPDEYFNEKYIHIMDLDRLDNESSIIYKDHYYFMIRGDFLVTNLKLTTTISRLQTYINWIIEKERKNLFFEFTPLVKMVDGLKIIDLKSVKVIDPQIDNYSKNTEEKTEVKRFAIDVLKSVLKDVISLDDILLSEVVSAEVLLKFKKPAKMDPEDYEKELGAYLKPISDMNNVTFYPKKGSPISAEEIQVIKEVDIDTTSTNLLSEHHLKQEMERFLNELNNNEES